MSEEAVSHLYVVREPLPARRLVVDDAETSRVHRSRRSLLLPVGEALEVWEDGTAPEAGGWARVYAFTRAVSAGSIFDVRWDELLARCDYDGEWDALEV